MENKFVEYVTQLRASLPIGKTFDMVERNIIVGGKEVYFYYIDAFTKDEIMQYLMTRFFQITSKEMDEYHTALDFIKNQIPYIEVIKENNIENMVKWVLSGQTVMLIDGYADAIVIDVRTYPVRSVAEPEKEKSLRGAKDGFVETLIFNTAMVRRRIRDPKLIFKVFNVGEKTKTDVALGYIDGVADQKQVDKIIEKIKKIKVQSLTVGDQSLVEALGGRGHISPFPKVRYTQRPDVVAAHLTEGKIVIFTDNSPTALMLPTCLFDFMQDVDDYYFPIITGNYFRLVRTLNMLIIMFLTPVYLLIAENYVAVPEYLHFLAPDEGYSIPLFLQFILLEIAIDALKLASLNTPSSLGMSLSVIGALILGEFSITAGWFIPQTILCMAVVALGGFTNPSIELSYAIKFMRILMIIGVAVYGLWGVITAFVIFLLIMAFTKSLLGTPYLFPLIPFDGKQLSHMLFRTKS